MTEDKSYKDYTEYTQEEKESIDKLAVSLIRIPELLQLVERELFKTMTEAEASNFLEDLLNAFKLLDFSDPDISSYFEAVIPAPRAARYYVPYLWALYQKEKDTPLLHGVPLGYIVQIAIDEDGKPTETKYKDFVERAIQWQREHDAERLPLDIYRQATAEDTKTYLPVSGMASAAAYPESDISSAFIVPASEFSPEEFILFVWNRLPEDMKQEITLEDVRLLCEIEACCRLYHMQAIPFKALFRRIYKRDPLDLTEIKPLQAAINRLRGVDVIIGQGDGTNIDAHYKQRYLLNCDIEVDILIKGGLTAGIRVNEPSPLMDLLRSHGQLRIIPAKILYAPLTAYKGEKMQIPAVRAIRRNQQLIYYLAMRISSMKDTERARRHNILWDTVYTWARLPEAATKQQRYDVRKACDTILSHFIRIGFIYGYELTDRDIIIYPTAPKKRGRNKQGAVT